MSVNSYADSPECDVVVVVREQKLVLKPTNHKRSRRWSSSQGQIRSRWRTFVEEEKPMLAWRIESLWRQYCRKAYSVMR